jgi:glutamine amidotransferase
MSKNIVIVDYGHGNLFSIVQACHFLGYSTTLSSNPHLILGASNLILPGVGSFEIAMKKLQQYDLIETLAKFVKSGKPIMGVCLGMQLLFDESSEFGKHTGLGFIKGKVIKFPEIVNNQKIRIPHIGWNTIYKSELDWLATPLVNTNNESLMYFVHSYYVKPDSNDNILTYSNYSGFEFCSSVKKDNIFGFQFHPEKSGKEGLCIYDNFLKIKI